MNESPKNHTYTLTEQGTDKYPDLKTAQAAALPAVAQALADGILQGIANGVFTVCIEGDKRVVRLASEESQ